MVSAQVHNSFHCPFWPPGQFRPSSVTFFSDFSCCGYNRSPLVAVRAEERPAWPTPVWCGHALCSHCPAKQKKLQPRCEKSGVTREPRLAKQAIDRIIGCSPLLLRSCRPRTPASSSISCRFFASSSSAHFPPYSSQPGGSLRFESVSARLRPDRLNSTLSEHRMSEIVHPTIKGERCRPSARTPCPSSDIGC